MGKKLRVGVLGATGMVGQRFIISPERRPWYEVAAAATSLRSAGRVYEEAVGDRWKMATPMLEAVKELVAVNVSEVEVVAASVDFMFSAADMAKEEIKTIEEAYAKTKTPMVSNNNARRWTPDVPVVISEVGPGHFKVVGHQRGRFGTTKGFIAVKPSYSTQSYALVLPAWKEFEPYEVVATTYQAISGVEKTFRDQPGAVENITPYIGGEEEKSEQELLRIWDETKDGEITKAAKPVITRQCIRVSVLNRHTVTVFVEFRRKPFRGELTERLMSFKGLPQELKLPNTPGQFTQCMEEDNRPQVTLDTDLKNGMRISVGRLREDTVYDYKFVGLFHSTVRGAASGAALCVGLLTVRGYIEAK